MFFPRWPASHAMWVHGSSVFCSTPFCSFCWVWCVDYHQEHSVHSPHLCLILVHSCPSLCSITITITTTTVTTTAEVIKHKWEVCSNSPAGFNCFFLGSLDICQCLCIPWCDLFSVHTGRQSLLYTQCTVSVLSSFSTLLLLLMNSAMINVICPWFRLVHCISSTWLVFNVVDDVFKGTFTCLLDLLQPSVTHPFFCGLPCCIVYTRAARAFTLDCPTMFLPMCTTQRLCSFSEDHFTQCKNKSCSSVLNECDCFPNPSTKFVLRLLQKPLSILFCIR